MARLTQYRLLTESVYTTAEEIIEKGNCFFVLSARTTTLVHEGVEKPVVQYVIVNYSDPGVHKIFSLSYNERRAVWAQHFQHNNEPVENCMLQRDRLKNAPAHYSPVWNVADAGDDGYEERYQIMIQYLNHNPMVMLPETVEDVHYEVDEVELDFEEKPRKRNR